MPPRTELPERQGLEHRAPHREVVGGLWEVLGPLQFRFLVDQGLQPDMKLVDVGCGCLRGGVHFARYLDAGNYYGLDPDESLLEAGFHVELPLAGLSGRVPRAHLLRSADFAVGSWGVTFDMGIAQSVFTHLPDASLRLCLERLAAVMRPGGRFFATYFDCPENWPREVPRTVPGRGGPTFHDRDPYHYRPFDLRRATEGLPWNLHDLGAWSHPRGQHIAEFVRL